MRRELLKQVSETELKNLISESVKEELNNLHQPKPQMSLFLINLRLLLDLCIIGLSIADAIIQIIIASI